MRTYDLTPLFRTTVGFDRWNDLFDTVFGAEAPDVSYPPYNIEKTGEDSYRIVMAVAGFGEDDLAVTIKDNLLVVSGKLNGKDGAGGAYLHRGIAARAFERKFSLADHVQATGASLTNGLIEINLVRELPEAMKPRRIAISTRPDSKKKVIEGKKAA